jgi:hypothetical protein
MVLGPSFNYTKHMLKKSDRKFIRLEKARIRRQFLDVKKQQELISELYKRFLGEKSGVASKTAVAKPQPKKETKKVEAKPKAKKEKSAGKKSK